MGLINGPRLLSCGWAISQGGGHGNLRAWPYEWVEQLQPRSAFADGPLDCRQLVRRNFGMGADVIKIYVSEGVFGDPQMDVPNFTLEEVKAMTDEAHRRGKKVAAHVSGRDNVQRAVEGGVDTVEHGTGASRQTLDIMAANGIVLVPTLSGPNRYEALHGWTRGGPSLSEQRAELVAAALLPGLRLGPAVTAITMLPVETPKNSFIW